jgi:hypothetical protein
MKEISKHKPKGKRGLGDIAEEMGGLTLHLRAEQAKRLNA